jgi:hypothetical protein
VAGPFDDPVIGRLLDWRVAASYDVLLDSDPYGMAWEWPRRTDAYRSAWSGLTRALRAPPAHVFGLERYEDPSLPVPTARPIWSAAVYSDVLRAYVSDPFAAERDRVDLRLLSRFVSVAISDDEIEHFLLSDGLHSIRIDVVLGTLIGCPSGLTYHLHGISGLKGPMRSLERLARVVKTGQLEASSRISMQRRHRWIAELRVADALSERADHQAIARALYGAAISSSRWRLESASYRRRVQRLVAHARRRRARPLEGWFEADTGSATAKGSSTGRANT